jgi:hypothetical protein
MGLRDESVAEVRVKQQAQQTFIQRRDAAIVSIGEQSRARAEAELAKWFTSMGLDPSRASHTYIKRTYLVGSETPGADDYYDRFEVEFEWSEDDLSFHATYIDKFLFLRYGLSPKWYYSSFDPRIVKIGNRRLKSSMSAKTKLEIGEALTKARYE